MSQKKLRILIFEDDPNISKLMGELFVRRGHFVQIYPSPTDCPLYKMHKEKCDSMRSCFDVIISDVNMPRVSGIELFSKQRQCGCKIPHQNKALMSSCITFEQGLEIKKLDCMFFKKPFRISEILTWAEDCVKRSFHHHSVKT